MARRGAPTKNHDWVYKVLDLMEEGASLSDALRQTKGASNGSFYRYVVKYPDLWEKYAIVRKVRSHQTFDEIADLEAKVLSGMLDPQAANVVINSRKWRLARMDRKNYSEKTEIEHSGNIEINITE